MLFRGRGNGLLCFLQLPAYRRFFQIPDMLFNISLVCLERSPVPLLRQDSRQLRLAFRFISDCFQFSMLDGKLIDIAPVGFVWHGKLRAVRKGQRGPMDRAGQELYPFDFRMIIKLINVSRYSRAGSFV